MLKKFWWSTEQLVKAPKRQLGKLLFQLFNLTKWQFVGLGLLAIYLSACQQPPTATNNPSDDIAAKATNYLRSHLKLPANSEITVKSQQAQTWFRDDLCQITTPTQPGYQVILLAADIRYTLHTNKDASKIEICASQDEKPPTTVKYVGAGYTVKYPADWQVVDEGLERSGASKVRFVVGTNPQTSPRYVLITRSPASKLPPTNNIGIKEFKSEPYDVSKLGADTGIKQTYRQTITDTSGNSQNWQFKVLLINKDDFVYEIKSAELIGNAPSDLIFEQFTNSFELIK